MTVRSALRARLVACMHRQMPLSIDDIRAAVALSPTGVRTDFDLNPDVKAAQLGLHKQRPAAVLCCLRPWSGGFRVILTERAGHLKQHAGQVAFPGGKIDPKDPSAEGAALREAEEEIGLPRGHVEVLGAIDPYLTSTGFHVTPVIGLVQTVWDPVPDPNEVARVFEPPLDFLMNPANRQRHHHDRNGYRRYYYAMPWEGFYIWGATAGMLKGLSDRLEVVTRGAA
ncbi:MAG: CoA pyrophosphatase [Paracoccaceae bacterium]